MIDRAEGFSAVYHPQVPRRASTITPPRASTASQSPRSAAAARRGIRASAERTPALPVAAVPREERISQFLPRGTYLENSPTPRASTRSAAPSGPAWGAPRLGRPSPLRADKEPAPTGFAGVGFSGAGARIDPLDPGSKPHHLKLDRVASLAHKLLCLRERKS